MIYSRAFSMPNGNTFLMKPVAAFIARNINRAGLIVDPFARNSTFADITNDLNPKTGAQHHMDAVSFLKTLDGRDDITTVLFDPPYSPRQISECYAEAGLTATMKDTQNARFYKECRLAMMKFLGPGAVVLSFGWNSVGMGKGWRRIETMLVYHGGAHNDTICCADLLEITHDSRDVGLRREAGGSCTAGGAVHSGYQDSTSERIQSKAADIFSSGCDSKNAHCEIANLAQPLPPPPY